MMIKVASNNPKIQVQTHTWDEGGGESERDAKAKNRFQKLDRLLFWRKSLNLDMQWQTSHFSYSQFGDEYKKINIRMRDVEKEAIVNKYSHYLLTCKFGEIFIRSH